MTPPIPKHTEQTPQDLIAEAVATCRTLASLLAEENEALQAHDMTDMEARYKTKRRLSAKMEGMIRQIKERREVILGEVDVQGQVRALEVSLGDYRDQANKNLKLLRAAHASTAGFLDMVRQAVDAQKPRVETYGKNGQMQHGAGETTLINKEV